MCASFEKTVTEILIENTKKAIEHINNVVADSISAHETDEKSNSNIVGADDSVCPQNKLVLAGGVSANSYIRNEFEKLQKEENIQIYYPELKLCTDNAAMIASAGYYNYLAGNVSDFTLNAIPSLKL